MNSLEKFPNQERIEQYYLQDSRSYVGNDILFWADAGGYTTDLSKAEVFTKEDAIEHHQGRRTDIPWPKEYLDNKTRPAVDMQYVKIKEALKGSGIKLLKPKKYRSPMYNCWGCGRFMTQEQIYSIDCPNCGSDNSP